MDPLAGCMVVVLIAWWTAVAIASLLGKFHLKELWTELNGLNVQK